MPWLTSSMNGLAKSSKLALAESQSSRMRLCCARAWSFSWGIPWMWNLISGVWPWNEAAIMPLSSADCCFNAGWRCHFPEFWCVWQNVFDMPWLPCNLCKGVLSKSCISKGSLEQVKVDHSNKGFKTAKRWRCHQRWYLLFALTLR